MSSCQRAAVVAGPIGSPLRLGRKAVSGQRRYHGLLYRTHRRAAPLAIISRVTSTARSLPETQKSYADPGHPSVRIIWSWLRGIELWPASFDMVKSGWCVSFTPAAEEEEIKEETNFNFNYCFCFRAHTQVIHVRPDNQRAPSCNPNRGKGGEKITRCVPPIIAIETDPIWESTSPHAIDDTVDCGLRNGHPERREIAARFISRS